MGPIMWFLWSSMNPLLGEPIFNSWSNLMKSKFKWKDSFSLSLSEMNYPFLSFSICLGCGACLSWRKAVGPELLIFLGALTSLSLECYLSFNGIMEINPSMNMTHNQEIFGPPHLSNGRDLHQWFSSMKAELHTPKWKKKSNESDKSVSFLLF